jgi:hypothetical protein
MPKVGSVLPSSRDPDDWYSYETRRANQQSSHSRVVLRHQRLPHFGTWSRILSNGYGPGQPEAVLGSFFVADREDTWSVSGRCLSAEEGSDAWTNSGLLLGEANRTAHHDSSLSLIYEEPL